jgi:hypothetical protein
MGNVRTMGADDMRVMLLKIKAMVDSDGRAADIVDDIQAMLSNESTPVHDPFPFPEEPIRNQLKLVI